MDSICLKCPTCHVHDCAEDWGPAPGWNWGTAKQDAVQAELVLAVDLPSAKCTVGGNDRLKKIYMVVGSYFLRHIQSDMSL